MAFVGIADNLVDAEHIAENATNSVVGPVRHRRDIRTAGLLEKRIAHMKRLRANKSSNNTRTNKSSSNNRMVVV